MNTKPFVSRDCPYGHGPLETLAGWWALQGADVRTIQQSEAAGGPSNITMGDNGRAFLVKIRRCADCGLVMMFDEEVQ